VASSGIKFVQNFVRIGHLIQKLKGELKTVWSSHKPFFLKKGKQS
jgi:hypothetical protein